MQDLYKKLKIAIYILIPIGIILYLLFCNIPPSGILRDTLKFNTPKYGRGFVSSLYPENRVSDVKLDDTGIFILSLKNDNVYFDIILPVLAYKDISLKMKIRNTTSSPEILLGAHAGKDFQYKYRLFSHRFLDKIDWDYIRDKDIVLFQKNKNYASIEEFINDPPKDSLTAVHHTAPTPQLFMPDYKPSEKQTRINHTLRGRHIFFVYVKDRPINLSFTKKFYKTPADDAKEFLKIRDFRNRELLSKDIFEEKDYNASLDNLKEGLYKIDMAVTDASLLENIVFDLDKVVIKDWVFLADNPEYGKDLVPSNLILLSNNLKVVTTHENGYQEIKIDNQNYNISEAQKNYEISQYFPEFFKKERTEISVPKNDLELVSANGIFTFSENIDAFFNPTPPYVIRLDHETSKEEFDKAEYVLASYTKPIIDEAGWITNEYIFNMAELYEEENKAQFNITTLGLNISCEEIELQSIEGKLARPRLSIQEIKSLVKKILNKL
ncbi:MAG: hypothetical protein ACD_63C00180G0009 [uncultured bacterium]|nr:MAG: hypothetical protein ACD_63C00180G0009 [uncultured bacterium]